MGKFDRVFAALEALPEPRREEIAALLEDLFYGDIHAEDYALSEAQIADLRERARNPGPVATDQEVQDFFAKFGA
jgi:nicotinate-nucleotide pyrophosphorylase